MQVYFREFQRLAAAGDYLALGQRPVPTPAFFNWTADIVESLHLAAHPHQPALVLADDAGSRTLSYAELLGQANQLLNYWRQQGVRPHAAVLLIVPVCAELWPAYLAGIKGGPLNPEVIAPWQRGTGHWLRDGYGQTESTAMLYNLPGAALRLGSMGRPSFMYDVAIADDGGAGQPDLTEGHLVVRTDTGQPNGLFKDYYGDCFSSSGSSGLVVMPWRSRVMAGARALGWWGRGLATQPGA